MKHIALSLIKLYRSIVYIVYITYFYKDLPQQMPEKDDSCHHILYLGTDDNDWHFQHLCALELISLWQSFPSWL